MRKYLFLILPIAIFLALYINLMPVTTKPINETMHYKAIVEVYKNGKLLARTHNIITNIGKEFIEDKLTGSTQDGNLTKYISLSTGADCFQTSGVLANEITGSGLSRSEGTITDSGTGNFTVEHTFIATSTVLGIQSAGLHWYASGNDNMLACANFTSVNLEANNELTIKWIVTVS